MENVPIPEQAASTVFAQATVTSPSKEKAGDSGGNDYHRSGPPRIAGISGGASSGMMAALRASGAVLVFQKTAREASRTHESLDKLGRHRPIV